MNMEKPGFDMYSPLPNPDAVVRAGTAVIVLDERGRILLEKRSDSGLWGLPGGRIEPGESLVEAGLREVREETGLAVEIVGLVGIYSRVEEGRVVTFPDNGDVVQLIDIVMEARNPVGTLTHSHESERLEFFEPARLPHNRLCPPIRTPLRDYLDGHRGMLD